MARKYKDLTGMRFGKLTVLYEVGSERDKWGHMRHIWCAQCDCGNKINYPAHYFKEGPKAVQSCGCEKHNNTMKALAKAQEACKKQNEFMMFEDCPDCIVFDASNHGFYISNDDIEKVKQHYWYVDMKTGYVWTHEYNPETKKDHKLGLHTFLMDGAQYVDHINHEPRDNRRENLRVSYNRNVSNQSCNSINHELRSDNTSGITGVFFDKKTNKWISTLGYNYKTIRLGSFDTKEEAIEEREVAMDLLYPYYGFNK